MQTVTNTGDYIEDLPLADGRAIGLRPGQSFTEREGMILAPLTKKRKAALEKRGIKFASAEKPKAPAKEKPPEPVKPDPKP